MTIAQAGSPTSVKTAGSGTTGAMDSTVGTPNFFVLGISSPAPAYSSGQDSQTNTWADTSTNVNSASGISSGLPYSFASSLSGSHTFNTTLNVFYQGIIALAFSGVDSFDQSDGVSNNGPSTSHPASSSAMTPGGDGALLVSVLALDTADGAGTITPPTGFSLISELRTGSNWPLAVAIEIQPGAATARTPVWTTTNAVRSCATTGIWLAAAGGGGSSNGAAAYYYSQL